MSLADGDEQKIHIQNVSNSLQMMEDDRGLLGGVSGHVSVGVPGHVSIFQIFNTLRNASQTEIYIKTHAPPPCLPPQKKIVNVFKIILCDILWYWAILGDIG
jgi:hypothetical protein